MDDDTKIEGLGKPNVFMLSSGDETCQRCGEVEPRLIVLGGMRHCFACWASDLERAGRALVRVLARRTTD